MLKGDKMTHQCKKKKITKYEIEEWYSDDETIQQYQERYGDEWLKKLNNTYEKMLSKLDEEGLVVKNIYRENILTMFIMRKQEYQGKKVLTRR